MIIPHADYPKDQGPFNVIKMLPELFEDIDFADFASTLRPNKIYDFFDSEMFLYASQYQSNYGAKLVMLLSAIERTNGTWKSLEEVLRSKKFKKKLRDCENGKKAQVLIDEEIEGYLNNFGSTRSVVKFYQDNLTVEDKKRLVYGIHYAHTYKKQKVGDFTLFNQVRTPDKEFNNEEESLNHELGRRLRHVVYDIRSAFVHNASYVPFPDKKYIKNRNIFTYERKEQGLPKEQWVITLPFEALYEISRQAYIEYWRKEYNSKKASVSKP